MKKNLVLSLVSFLISFFLFSCSKDENKISTTGILKGTVTDFSNNQTLANVRITVYDATTNAPTAYSTVSNSNGAYSIQLLPGTYYLKLSKQGCVDIPEQGISPATLTVELDKETIGDYQMHPSSVTNGGYISGKVTSGGKALAGVMVVASDSLSGYSSVSGSDGVYYIYNIPAGNYKVKGYLANYNSTEADVTVTANTESSGKDITLTSGATGSLSGMVSFLATNNGEVDVTLAHPITKETIPGLVTKTVGGIYTLNYIPNGVYTAKASYNNDGYVVDPDWIIKNGEPTVTINNNKVTMNFSVTGAVRLNSPTNDSTTTKPIEITETSPTFSWTAYSSTNDYVIEVSDISGKIIWGGFTKSGSTITKNIVIPKNQLSIVFNADGKAKSSLIKGMPYRWKIYASKDDTKETNGWKLISVSEEQRGLFIIK
ncbi:MAG: carboxypeptidase-like regulatory domain-containing protein [Bacteroidota bacterium]|nr:carboxypeptidase-like regulatory domain-containing protein [Bacteroidota bacterium]